MELERIFKRVPELKQVIDLVARHVDEFPTENHAYNACKRMVNEFVGWGSADQDMQDSLSYDRVMEYVIDVLDF